MSTSRSIYGGGGAPFNGGTVTGSIGIGGTPGEALDVAGDTTTPRRIATHSYFETDGLGTAETVRLHTGPPAGKTGNSAKNAIAFFQDDISSTGSQVWLQAHDYLHWYNAQTFAPAAVNTGTDRITVTAHGLPSSPGWRVQFTTTGTLPGGLSVATNYYAKRIDNDTVEAYTDAALSSKVDLTSQGAGTHTFTPDNTFNNNRHRHFSIEVTNSDLVSKNTRLSIPWGYDVTEIGTFQANVNVNDGALRVNGAAGANRDLQLGGALSDNLVPDLTNLRWAVRADNATESGANAGSNFRLVRFSDIGVPLDNPIFVQRSTGFVSLLGSTAPGTNLELGSSASGTVGMRIFRGATTNFASIFFTTGSTDQWSIQMRNDSTQTLHIRDAVNARDLVTLNQANGVVTLALGVAKGRTAVNDAAYTVLTTDNRICYTAITAARVVTLPSVSTASGQEFVIKDESGSCNGTNTITVTPASGTIDGAANKVINTAYGTLRVYSNGTNWFTW